MRYTPRPPGATARHGFARAAGTCQTKVLKHTIALEQFGHAESVLNQLCQSGTSRDTERFRFKIALARITVYAQQHAFGKAVDCHGELQKTLHLLPTTDKDSEVLAQILTEAGLAAITTNNHSHAIELLQSASEHARKASVGGAQVARIFRLLAHVLALVGQPARALSALDLAKAEHACQDGMLQRFVLLVKLNREPGADDVGATANVLADSFGQILTLPVLKTSTAVELINAAILPPRALEDEAIISAIQQLRQRVAGNGDAQEFEVCSLRSAFALGAVDFTEMLIEDMLHR